MTDKTVSGGGQLSWSSSILISIDKKYNHFISFQGRKTRWQKFSQKYSSKFSKANDAMVHGQKHWKVRGTWTLKETDWQNVRPARPWLLGQHVNWLIVIITSLRALQSDLGWSMSTTAWSAVMYFVQETYTQFIPVRAGREKMEGMRKLYDKNTWES